MPLPCWKYRQARDGVFLHFFFCAVRANPFLVVDRQPLTRSHKSRHAPTGSRLSSSFVQSLSPISVIFSLSPPPLYQSNRIVFAIISFKFLHPFYRRLPCRPFFPLIMSLPSFPHGSVASRTSCVSPIPNPPFISLSALKARPLVSRLFPSRVPTSSSPDHSALKRSYRATTRCLSLPPVLSPLPPHSSFRFVILKIDHWRVALSSSSGKIERVRIQVPRTHPRLSERECHRRPLSTFIPARSLTSGPVLVPPSGTVAKSSPIVHISTQLKSNLHTKAAA